MLFVNCAAEEKSPIETLIDTGANADLITQKFINESGKVELQTSFSRASSTNVGGKHKSTDPVEFLVVEPDWPGPDLMLGNPWLQKNGAIINMCNNKLSIHDNFAIPIFQSG
nr:710_t:CDS:2 [Entrophospora candida]